MGDETHRGIILTESNLQINATSVFQKELYPYE